MNEIWHELSVRVNRLGQNEYRLSLLRAEDKSDANELARLIEEHRKPFEDGKVASIGSMVAANQETWVRIGEESEAAAKRELLKNSAELAELEKLENAANEAQEAADAKSRELQANWEEYNSLPDRIEGLNAWLTEIGNNLRELDADGLAKQYKDIYRSVLDGALTDHFALVFAAESIITRDLRKQLLNEVAGELQAELGDLKRRSKAH